MAGEQSELPAVGDPPRLGEAHRDLHGGPVVRMGEQDLAHPAERTPRAGGGEGRAGGEVEQQDAVHEQRGGGPRRTAERGRADRAGAAGEGQSVGGTGAEQSQFHTKILPRRVPRRAPG
ncbi:hypothetical protein SALBM135S_06765 [Streptomyces alboniger]